MYSITLSFNKYVSKPVKEEALLLVLKIQA